jgi:hypothetical protein
LNRASGSPERRKHCEKRRGAEEKFLHATAVETPFYASGMREPAGLPVKVKGSPFSGVKTAENVPP